MNILSQAPVKEVLGSWVGHVPRSEQNSQGALMEYGDVELLVSMGAPPSHLLQDRVIAVPFLVKSGRVNIEGPEEEADQRHLQLAAGDYRLWCTQRGVNDQLQQVHLFFEKLPSPLERSSIITADEDLCPPDELVETSEVAEV
jgi:hypothetical protein